jgi:hypothetical protein
MLAHVATQLHDRLWVLFDIKCHLCLTRVNKCLMHAGGVGSIYPDGIRTTGDGLCTWADRTLIIRYKTSKPVCELMRNTNFVTSRLVIIGETLDTNILRAIRRLHGLKNLVIVDCYLDYEVVSLIPQLTGLTYLRIDPAVHGRGGRPSLPTPWNRISGNLIKHITAMPLLTHLCLKLRTPLTPHDKEVLCRVKPTSLIQLDLVCTSRLDLSFLVHMSTLKCLSLFFGVRDRLTTDDFLLLCDLSLTNLRICENDYTNAGDSMIKTLQDKGVEITTIGFYG